MPLSYQNIPLELLLNKAHFEQASELTISTSSIDLHFVQVYLATLRNDLTIKIAYSESEKGALKFLTQSTYRRYYFLKLPAQNFLHQKELLIQTPNTKISILTSAPFTKKGIVDTFSCHLYSDDPIDYSNYKKQFIFRSFKKRKK